MPEQFISAGLPADSFALIICPGGEGGGSDAETAARDGARALRRGLTGVGGLPGDRVQIFDGSSSPAELALALTRAGSVPTEVLLICWLGPIGGSGAEPLLVGDPAAAGSRSGTLRFSQLLALAAASPARHRVVLVDGWRTGGDQVPATGADLVGSFLAAATRQGPALELLVAVSESEAVFAAGGLPPAVAEVNRLLAGGDPDGAELLTVGGVFAAAQRRLGSASDVQAAHLTGAAAATPLARNVARLTPTDAGHSPKTVLLPNDQPPVPVPVAAELVATADVQATSPYPGLSSFDADSADYFFGRSETVAEVVAALLDRPADAGPLVLVGASGAGKSSVLRAGVLPALRRGELPGLTPDHIQVVITPGEHPLTALVTRVLDEVAPPALAQVIVDAVRAEPARFATIISELLVHGRPHDPTVIPDLATTPITARSLEIPGGRLVVAIDQFEETFTLCADEAERAAFVTALVSLTAPRRNGAPSPALVLITVRGDFYLQCVEYPELAHALARGQVVVGPMQPEETREAVVAPATAAGLRVEPALVELILDDLAADGGSAGSGSLPLLAHALRATWELRVGGTLTADGYRHVGRLTGALAKTADDWFTSLDAPAQEAAQALLLGLVRVGELGEVTRRPRSRAMLLAEVEAPGAAAVLDQLIGGLRLVEADEDRVQITHEALLRSWPRLRGWLELDRAGAVLRQRLDDGGHDWVAHGQDLSLLLRGQRLAAAQEWVEGGGRRRPLASPAAEFYDASVAQERAEAAQSRRRTRRLRALVAALTALVLVAAGMTTFALISRSNSETAKNKATAAQQVAQSAHVASIAEAETSTNSEIGAQMALSAYGLADTPEARTALLDAYTPTRVLNAHKASIDAVAWSPDGRTVASGSDDGTVKLWDVTQLPTPTIRPLGFPLSQGSASDYVKAVAFDRTGHLLAVGTAPSGGSGEVRIYDVTNPAAPKLRDTLPQAPSGVFALAFSPTTDLLAVGGYGTQVDLFDVATPGLPLRVGAVKGSATRDVHAVVFSPDGTLLATGSEDGYAYLWHVGDPAATGSPQVLYNGLANWQDPGAVRAIAFDPSGTALSVGTALDYLIEFSVKNGVAKQVGRLTAVNDSVYALGYVNAHSLGVDQSGWNGLSFYEAGINTVNQSSSPAAGQELDDGSGALLVSYQRAVAWSFALDPQDRTWTVTAGEDGALRFAEWFQPLTYRQSAPVEVFAGPDDSTLTYTYAGDLFVYDIVNRPGVRPTEQLVKAVHLGNQGIYNSGEASYSAAAGLLAVGTPDRIQLWDVSKAAIASWPSYDPAKAPPSISPLLDTADSKTSAVAAVALSPDGRRLAIGTDKGGVELVDVSDPREPKLLGQRLAALGPLASVKVAFNPTGTLLAATSDDKNLMLWPVSENLANPPEGTLTFDDGQGAAPVFSPDGRLLAVGGTKGQVRLIDVTDPHRPVVRGVTASQNFGILAVAFSPDGTEIVAGGGIDARVWDVSDVAEPRWVLSLPASDPVFALTFLHGGQWVMEGLNGSDSVLYDLNISRQVSYLCNLKGDVVTEQEWNNYLPDVPYRKPCG